MFADYGESVPYTIKHDTSSSRRQREGYWEAAASLQAVDGLEPSAAARRMAGAYIEGEYPSTSLVARVEGYHGRDGADPDPGSREADVVAARIVRLLESSPFTLSPRTLLGIHSSLFSDVLDPSWVGRFRTVNLTKDEPVLGGRTVQYADYASIQPTLEYDFMEERSRPRGDLSDPAEVRRLSRFIANMWQVHAFREGNTRTTAVFSELYLRSLGAQVDNAPFAGNGPLFRDALVRANFSDLQAGIDENLDFIASFYDSVVNGRPYPYSPSDLNVHGIRAADGIAYREGFALDLPAGRVEGLEGAARRAASLTAPVPRGPGAAPSSSL